MKLGEKDAARIRSLSEASAKADVIQARATRLVAQAEAEERRAIQAASRADAELGMAMRDAALKAGIDPLTPFKIRDGEIVAE